MSSNPWDACGAKAFGLNVAWIERVTLGCNPSNVNAALNPTGNDIEASTVSLFVGHNVMHDWAYYLGFDEGHWNAQQYNNGVTTVDRHRLPAGRLSRHSLTTG